MSSGPRIGCCIIGRTDAWSVGDVDFGFMDSISAAKTMPIKMFLPFMLYQIVENRT